jgi:hypothetical protein
MSLFAALFLLTVLGLVTIEYIEYYPNKASLLAVNYTNDIKTLKRSV